MVSGSEVVEYGALAVEKDPGCSGGTGFVCMEIAGDSKESEGFWFFSNAFCYKSGFVLMFFFGVGVPYGFKQTLLDSWEKSSQTGSLPQASFKSDMWS